MELFAFDDDYVRRLREGDRWTEEHFESYFHQLLLIKLRATLRTLEEIDDVRQEVYVRVLKAIRADGLRDGRKLGAFVVTVCNNILHERYRTGARTEPFDAKRHDVAGGDDVEQALATHETEERVRRVLASMPSRDADLLRACFLDERDKDEVCRAMGVDRNYLRVLLHRAKERFRSEYAAGEVVQFKTK